jgi:hypothetical protein
MGGLAGSTPSKPRRSSRAIGPGIPCLASRATEEGRFDRYFGLWGLEETALSFSEISSSTSGTPMSGLTTGPLGPAEHAYRLGRGLANVGYYAESFWSEAQQEDEEEG